MVFSRCRRSWFGPPTITICPRPTRASPVSTYPSTRRRRCSSKNLPPPSKRALSASSRFPIEINAWLRFASLPIASSITVCCVGGDNWVVDAGNCIHDVPPLSLITSSSNTVIINFLFFEKEQCRLFLCFSTCCWSVDMVIDVCVGVFIYSPTLLCYPHSAPVECGQMNRISCVGTNILNSPRLFYRLIPFRNFQRVLSLSLSYFPSVTNVWFDRC